jgi:hypothetical protein
MEQVKASLCAAKNNDQRERDLPKRSLVYLVIGMALFSDASYVEVYRQLEETQKWLFGPSRGIKVPAKSSITYGRQRLGTEALEHLFRSVVRPIAIVGETRGAFFRGLRVVAIDGLVLNVLDTEANANEFQRAASQNGPAGYPYVRMVALVECGTHVLFDYELSSKEAASEQALGEKLLPRVERGQLLLADRLYADGKKWRLATERGADAIFRVKADTRLEVEEVLADGSYMSTLFEGERSKKREMKGHRVRVVEFEVKQDGKLKENYRLITTLDYEEAKAEEIAQLYRERWEWECFADEFKNDLNRFRDVLRSQTPELVRQELIAAFLAHFAIRSFMLEAAHSIEEDVDRISYRHTISVVKRRAPMSGAFPPSRNT